MHGIRLFIKKFFFAINFVLALFSLLIFQLSYAADIRHWLGGFLGLLVPVIIGLNIFYIISYVISGSWRFVLSLIVLITAYPLMERTFKFTLPLNVPEEESVSVLSYNVMYLDSKNEERAFGLVRDILAIEADIKCFQELYNVKNNQVLEIVSKLKKENPHYTYMHSEVTDKKNDGVLGLAVFSKYPIIKKQEVSWKTNNNGMLIVDLKVNNDTLRIINVQLKSMGIRVSKAITRNEEVRAKEAKNIFSQLKQGFVDRSHQVDLLNQELSKSPYPVILAGDFNELPYGYAYGKIRKKLANAFESAGYGFGFTYHKLPSFLRIDNIFYEEKSFKILNFKTLSRYSYSDHYPIFATFSSK